MAWYVAESPFVVSLSSLQQKQGPGNGLNSFKTRFPVTISTIKWVKGAWNRCFFTSVICSLCLPFVSFDASSFFKICWGFCFVFVLFFISPKSEMQPCLIMKLTKIVVTYFTRSVVPASFGSENTTEFSVLNNWIDDSLYSKHSLISPLAVFLTFFLFFHLFKE